MNYNQAAEFGLQQLITRRLTTPGGLPAPTVAPEMFPVISLENDRPEWGFLKGERHMTGFYQGGPTVGNFEGVELRNPAGSGVIVVVNRIVTIAAADTRYYRAAAPIAGLLGGTAPMDLRDPMPGANINGIATIAGAAAPGLPPGGLMRRVEQGGYVEHRENWVLPPNTALQVYVGATNLLLTCWFNWTERGAQPGELA